jgi:hypothetical protein
VWFLNMEAPCLLLLFLLCAGFVSGQRSRSRILRERLYLETLANQTDVTNTTALNALVTKPLESTTTTPTPATEGMDYEGSGFLDVFWKLTALLPLLCLPRLNRLHQVQRQPPRPAPLPHLVKPVLTSMTVTITMSLHLLPLGGTQPLQRPGVLLSRRQPCLPLPGGQLVAQPL